MDSKDNTQLGIEALKSIDGIQRALDRGVALFNSMKVPTSLQGVPKIGVSLHASKESMRIISEIVAVELRDAEFIQEDVEKIMAAAVYALAEIQDKEMPAVEAKSVFEDAKVLVATPLKDKRLQKKQASKHREEQIREQTEKFSSTSSRKFSLPPLPAIPKKQKSKRPVAKEEPHVKARKEIDLSKIVTLAYVAMGTTSPIVGAGMLGRKYAAKHIPERLKRGIAGIAAGTTGAIISPGAALGVGLQHFKKPITIGLEKQVGKFTNRVSKTEKKEKAKQAAKGHKPKPSGYK